MPGEQTEILRYQMDTAEAEAGIARLAQLMEQVKAKRGAGQDTSEIEAQFARESEALAALAEKQRRSAAATDDLIQRKRQLAAVVSLVGGRFSGLIGQLSSVVQLLTSAGGATAAAGAALASVSVAVGVWQRARQEIEQAKRALDAWNEVVGALQAAKLGPAGEMAAVLQRFGQRTPETMGAAQAIYGQVGLQLGAAEPKLAALAAAAGIRDIGDVAALLTLQRRGAEEVQTPADLREALSRARQTGAYEALLAEAEAAAKDPVGRDVRAGFLLPGARGPAGERGPEAAYRHLRGAGFVGEDVTLERFKADLERVPALRKEIAQLESGLRVDVFARQATGAPERLRKAREELARLAPLEKYAEQVGREPAVSAGGVPAGIGELQPRAAPGIDALLNELAEQKRLQQEQLRLQQEQNRLLQRYMERAARQPQINIGTQLNRPDTRAAPVQPGLAPGIDLKVAY